MSVWFWIDLEMTGLDPLHDKILEVALIVTNYSLEPLGTYHKIVYQNEECLGVMSEYVRNMHEKTGLLSKIPHEGIAESRVDEELMTFVKGYLPSGEKAIIAGNSIHQDRKFIDGYLKKFSSLLHYRMLDVSSFKIVFNTLFQMKYKKKNTHAALDDINESIDELKFYLDKMKA